MSIDFRYFVKSADLLGALGGGVNTGMTGALLGGGAGGLYGLASGALGSRKGHRIRDTLVGGARGLVGGGLLGGGAGAGLGLSVGAHIPVREFLSGDLGRIEAARDRMRNINPNLFAGLTTASTLGGAALGGAAANTVLNPKDENEDNERADETKQDKPTERRKAAETPAHPTNNPNIKRVGMSKLERAAFMAQDRSAGAGRRKYQPQQASADKQAELNLSPLAGIKTPDKNKSVKDMIARLEQARKTREEKEKMQSQNKAAHLRKQAGPVSEYMSSFNPLNAYGGGLLGGLAALATPTKSLQQQAELDSNDGPGRALANFLVPGLGTYRWSKRMGAAIRSPEMKAIKAQRLLEEIAKAESSGVGTPAAAPAAAATDKKAGWVSEMAGSVLNPLSLFGGNIIGAGAAALTPTRNLRQQSEADDNMWSNLLIPGRGAYNGWKRIGAATRSPEMLQMRRKAKMDRLNREAGVNNKPKEEAKEPEKEKAASAFEFGKMVKRSFDWGQIGQTASRIWNDPTTQAGLMYGGLGAGLGGLHGLIAPGEYEDADGNVHRRGRLMGALRGALGGGAIGGLAGAGAQEGRYQYLKRLAGSGGAGYVPTDRASAQPYVEQFAPEWLKTSPVQAAQNAYSAVAGAAKGFIPKKPGNAPSTGVETPAKAPEVKKTDDEPAPPAAT